MASASSNSSLQPPPPTSIYDDVNFQTLDLETESKELQVDLKRSYGESSSSKSEEDNPEVFSVYFKGLLSGERVKAPEFLKKTMRMAGIGVAICNSKQDLIFEMKKPLDLIKGGDRQSVEGQALIEALNAAISLKLKRIVFFCDYYPLYQFVSGWWRPKQQKIINLLDQVNLLRKSFTYCEHSLIARKDVKFAFKLAREAINSQISKPVSFQEKLENCVICLDDKSVEQFLSVEGCTHRYCSSCVKQHVEVKLLNGVLPKCPHEGCGNEFRFDSCEAFLNPKFTEMMRQRLKEESIPVTEKVYCPYPICSTLMSKTEALRLINDIGAITCYKCKCSFCIKCRVPWHENMNCAEYKRRNPTPIVEESKLKNLAARNLWQQCIKCKHMIELAAGCYHITCRCGYEFCYTCGAEWKDKKATCTCPLWDEENIIDADEEDDEVEVDGLIGFVDDDFEHDAIHEDEGDDFEHANLVDEDDDFSDEYEDESDDFEYDIVLEDEDDDFEHDAVLEDEDADFNDEDEGDDFEHDVVLEDDGDADVVLEDEGDDFEHDVVLEDESDDFNDDEGDDAKHGLEGEDNGFSDEDTGDDFEHDDYSNEYEGDDFDDDGGDDDEYW